jgi:hypothetical protein
MKKIVAMTLLAMCVCLTSYSFAEDEPAKGKFAGKFDITTILKKLDENSDGKVSKDEFKKLAEKMNKGDGKGEKMFEMLDANKDGFIDESESKKLSEMKGKFGKGDLKGKLTPEQIEKLKEKLKNKKDGEKSEKEEATGNDLKEAFEKAAAAAKEKK